MQLFSRMVFGMVYYGVALAAGDLGGKLYRDYILQALVEFPAIGMGIYVCNRYVNLQIYFFFLLTQSHYKSAMYYVLCVKLLKTFESYLKIVRQTY